MIKVAVVDDHAIFRQGVINVLKKDENITVVFEAKNGKEFIDLLPQHSLPDVLLLDIQMPIMNGYETLDYVHKHHPEVKVVMISMIQDSITVNNLMLRGACGFISKNAEPDAIIEVVLKSVNKPIEFGEPNHNIVLPDDDQNPIDLSKAAVLTEKEYELLKYSSTSFTYEQIAGTMLVSPKALEHYRVSLFHKLNVKSRQELASLAVKMGLAT
jgi:DNA-binding NarL/FixJ family response regulator